MAAMCNSALQTCPDTSEHLVGALRAFLSDNNISLARNTIINMHQVQGTQEGNPMTYKLLLETEVISIGQTTGHGHDSGIGSFSPSDSIAPFDSAADQGYSEGEMFGDAETSFDFVSPPSPSFLFSPEQIDHVHFSDDPKTDSPSTPLQLPEYQPSHLNTSPQIVGENWVCNGPSSSHLLASTDLEAMSGDAPMPLDLGNLDEGVDMTTSTLATTCQRSRDTPNMQVQHEGHSYQCSSHNGKTGPNNDRLASQAPSAVTGSSSLPANQQKLSDIFRSSENQTAPKKTEVSVISAARSILRTDYLEYLEAELPRWAKGGLWDHEPGSSDGQLLIADPDYYDLQIAYSDVCQLHTWIEDDVIRSRMALIRLHLEYLRTCESWRTRRGKGRRIGRGDSTCIIDHILRKIHHDWPTLSKAQCSRLRARFHERKRYGKRWAVLADGLGKSILFLCSPKVAAMVCNTTVTFKMLSVLVDQVRSYGGDIMSLLDYMKPLADSLCPGESLSVREVDIILEKVRYHKISITE